MKPDDEDRSTKDVKSITFISINHRRTLRASVKLYDHDTACAWIMWGGFVHVEVYR